MPSWAHIKFKNIIFDLGGVIIDLSVDSTLRKFSELSGHPVDKVIDIYHTRPEFLAYEKGEITNDEFRSALRDIFGMRSLDSELDLCWNAMLGGIPAERIELLRELKQKYKTFLLSNTNAIHLDCFSGIVKKAHNLESLEPLFHKTYYSHLMKMRKPDPEIYEYVLRENNLQAGETIFLDDNVSNLKGAASVGIQTFHVTHPDTIFSLFR
ncbi:MAG TPA: HAD family phosphatase [Cyclobacteriaceae bacterium]|nr:HAD family phosphatase [Cyclobacteriaceae bacterium]